MLVHVKELRLCLVIWVHCIFFLLPFFLFSPPFFSVAQPYLHFHYHTLVAVRHECEGADPMPLVHTDDEAPLWPCDGRRPGELFT